MTDPEPMITLSWSDDGVELECRRPECMVDFTAVVRHGQSPMTWKVWYTEPLKPPYTIEQAAKQRDAHLEKHASGEAS